MGPGMAGAATVLRISSGSAGSAGRGDLHVRVLCAEALFTRPETASGGQRPRRRSLQLGRGRDLCRRFSQVVVVGSLEPATSSTTKNTWLPPGLHQRGGLNADGTKASQATLERKVDIAAFPGMPTTSYRHRFHVIAVNLFGDLVFRPPVAGLAALLRAVDGALSPRAGRRS
jgi:hypothetical protein